ncbi:MULTISPECIES: type II toxin-antitoxin system Phd/YefM family antitoxin [Gallibacterium]|uniref:Stability protein StbD n=1 Tax=Gallibacterium genomosp. 3 TaxID=505345 RepID=A0A1A7NWA0_9PAST|nr:MULTISPECIES: stability protein StbD [Gallibacterium]MDA3979489.1 stability protein StbD [Gallibacterium sp. AGMB14963]OBW93279.1 stability protein StbD [Gallibacterium genomosp. 3]OBX03984.1 stability protein StbD [Gallibacterium genomosp. 3]OBX06299.1 stability protein StbD [Gallibacterium genomosp. 3]
MAIHQILTSNVASITDLKKNPMGVITQGTIEDGAIAILNRNEPVFYCVSPELFAYIQEVLEDAELGEQAKQRLATLEPVEVTLDDL